jgi:hypothetical protein
MNLRRLGLMCVVATAAALIAAGPAMAVTGLEEVVLCKNHNEFCSNTFASGTVFHGELVSGADFTLLAAPFGTVLCASASLLGTTTSGLFHGEITSLSFEDCELVERSGTCTVTTEHLNYLIKGELTSSHTAYEVLITEKSGNGWPQIHVVCGIWMNCKFGSSTILYEALLEPNDMVWDLLQETGQEGGFCPSTSTWHVKYLVRCLEGTSLVGCWSKMHFT